MSAPRLTGMAIMYDVKRATIESLRTRFERQMADGAPDFRRTAHDYIEALTDFVETFNEGPGADPRLLGLDTTGELARMEEHAAWAEEERRRVRRLLNDTR